MFGRVIFLVPALAVLVAEAAAKSPWNIITILTDDQVCFTGGENCADNPRRATVPP